MAKNNNKTISAVARDKKYLQFLMDVFLKTCKGYTKINFSSFYSLHKVDKASSIALQELGWLGKTGSVNATNYYWRGPAPTDEMAEEIQLKITKIKSVQKFNLENKKIPLSKTGKSLIPVINSIKPKANFSTAQKYLKVMENLYLEAGDFPRSFSLAAVAKENKIGTTVSKTLLRMNLLKKTDGKNQYQWIGPLPTLELAEQVLINVNNGVKSFIVPKVEKTITHEVVQTAMKAVAKDVRLPKVVRDGVVKPLSENELKKSIALKLLKLGELEQADKLLGEII